MVELENLYDTFNARGGPLGQELGPLDYYFKGLLRRRGKLIYCGDAREVYVFYNEEDSVEDVENEEQKLAEEKILTREELLKMREDELKET